MVTSHIGEFQVIETIKYCPSEDCKKIYRCEELSRLVAPGSKFGYDVLEYVGRSVWCENHDIQKIQKDLKDQNISISERAIACLAKKFVLYVIEAHKDQQEEIRKFLHKSGGYFLHFDSAHPGEGASHLMCAVAEEIDKKIQVVLGSVKLPRESKETVIDFLKTLKEKYGDPLAGISDMLASNLAAFQEVFPLVLLLICHFHFLRDLGRDWMSYENMQLGNFLATYDISKRLREFAKKCKASIEGIPLLAKSLNEKIDSSNFKSMPHMVQAYSMVIWILGYEQDLHGYGFPFDRSNLVYLQRMKKIFDCLDESSHGELEELQLLLACILQDSNLQKTMKSMEEKVTDFDCLRAIMQIAPIEEKEGLNDDGCECDMTLMEQQLQEFIDSDKIKNNQDATYKKIVKQIHKYWKMLFAKPIEVKRADGKVEFVYPQRTNNTMERFFRDFQRSECKRTGMDTLSRRVQSMIAETPMMKNLSNPEFMKIILKGHPTLAARFADLDIETIREKMKKIQSQEAPLVSIQKFIERSDFYKICMKTFSKDKKVA